MYVVLNDNVHSVIDKKKEVEEITDIAKFRTGNGERLDRISEDRTRNWNSEQTNKNIV